MISSCKFKGIQLCFFVGILLLNLFCSCKKFVEGDAPGYSITTNGVFSDNTASIAVLNGIYSDMMVNRPFSAGNNGLTVITSLSSDELSLYSGATNILQLALYRNKLTNQFAVGPWSFCYNYILRVNTAIEGLNKSTISSAVKAQLLGESYFLRAFYYFYLVNLYGDVPLPLTSDWRINTVLARSSKEDVWRQIVLDLTEAKSKLNEKYLRPDLITPYSTSLEERVRPTKWAASALLARAYLYLGEYQKAIEEASIVISNNSMFQLVANLNQVFLKNSKEAIWQLIPINNQNTDETQYFVLSGEPDASRPVYLSKFLLDSVEKGDKRFEAGNWVNQIKVGSTTYTFPFKYQANTFSGSVTEYLMVLRLAELFLIRAEAKIQLGLIQSGVDDINTIRNRARSTPTVLVPNPLPSIVAPNTKPEALLLVEKERMYELFTEWGHRWFDLRRNKRVDAVMNVITPLKSQGGIWDTNQQLYPIYWEDIRTNSHLGPNNPGY